MKPCTPCIVCGEPSVECDGKTYHMTLTVDTHVAQPQHVLPIRCITCFYPMVWSGREYVHVFNGHVIVPQPFCEIPRPYKYEPGTATSRIRKRRNNKSPFPWVLYEYQFGAWVGVAARATFTEIIDEFIKNPFDDMSYNEVKA